LYHEESRCRSRECFPSRTLNDLPVVNERGLIFPVGATAPVARADSVYEIQATTTPCKECTSFTVTGFYELNSHGQIVGPWAFSIPDGAVAGSGSNQTCPPAGEAGQSSCPFASVNNGIGYFSEGVDPDFGEILGWITFNLGAGPIGGSFYDFACFEGECGLGNFGTAAFTGTATLEWTEPLT
jgi:hypothetical protein